MTISIWRLAHLLLAAISSLFLLVATITGLVLAVEPIYEKSHGYDVEDPHSISISDLLVTLNNKYHDISEVNRDHNGFLALTTFGEAGEESFYIDPRTGESLGQIIKTPEIFQFSRILHRSLFMGEIGRFMVGLASLILVVMAVTGTKLILQKQGGGFKSYFQKVISEDFYRDYHTRLGKFTLALVLVIAITGVYLFLIRFSIVPNTVLEHKVDYENIQETPIRSIDQFDVFSSNTIADLEIITFPFSKFPDDFYILKTVGQEFQINQFTGEILSQTSQTNSSYLFELAFTIHTAEGLPWWAILLGLSSLCLLFFMYSGLIIYLNRRKHHTQFENQYLAEESEIIIAYGSETGSTLVFAQKFHSALLQSGQKSFLTQLNDVLPSPKMKSLVIFTSTYGAGGPPSNANNFIDNIDKWTLPKGVNYSIIGFGSKKYPDYCQFALDIANKLKAREDCHEMIPIHLINNNSLPQFRAWYSQIEPVLRITTAISFDFSSVERKTHQLKIASSIKSQNTEDSTYLLQLKARNGTLKDLESGDLLSYRPEQDNVERHYSMSVSKDKKLVTLSIKHHQDGVASSYLTSLTRNDRIEVGFLKNNAFHFPKDSNSVVMISNGTGIAPFLGMLQSNYSKVPTSLFWGGQNADSFELYRPIIDQLQTSGQLTNKYLAYSQVDNRQYVQDLLSDHQKEVIDTIKNHGHILICGSLKMQQAVEKFLDQIFSEKLQKSIQDYKNSGQIKSDCY